MRRYTLVLLFFILLSRLYGQVDPLWIEGKVSYITLQNIYARFDNPGVVQAGDTIFIRKDQKLIPLFVAESVSSTSCVGKPVVSIEMKPEDLVFVRGRLQAKKTTGGESVATVDRNVKLPEAVQEPTERILSKPIPVAERVQKIRGRLAASSYSGFSNSYDYNQRMRYTFSLAADHISGSKFSTDTYIMFTHKLNHWADVKDNLFNAMKIYSLSVNYDVNEHTRVAFGRKINSRIASVGAIDGLQAETSAGNFTFGAVVGSNPDYADYSFNARLFEYGAYVSHDYKNQAGQLVNSFGMFQQTNSGSTDRRFAYFQHENSLLKNLNLFLSCEVDLYALKNSLPANTLSLTSLYLSLNYRVSRKVSVFGSYDARKNIIYYETFKTYLDQMLEDATRQGYQFRINYNPARFVYSGISGAYRFRTNDLHPMINANGFLSFPQVPWINASVNFSTNWLKTSYVDGMIYGIRINRDIVPSKLSSGMYYRLVDYKYLNNSVGSLQHMAEVELSWQISKKLSFSANYDGTFGKSNQYNSIYLNLIKRF